MPNTICYDSKETKSTNLVTDNNVGTRENVSSIEEPDIRLSRNLRSANLRAISSLISQAGIASLFQDKGTKNTIVIWSSLKEIIQHEFFRIHIAGTKQRSFQQDFFNPEATMGNSSRFVERDAASSCYTESSKFIFIWKMFWLFKK